MAAVTELRASETETLRCRANLKAKESALREATAARDALRSRLRRLQAKNVGDSAAAVVDHGGASDASLSTTPTSKEQSPPASTASRKRPRAHGNAESAASAAATRDPCDRIRRQHRPFDVTTRSPLLLFRSYRLHPNYRDCHGLSLSSPTFSHRLDPKRKLCPFDLHGTCNDGGCSRQHTRDWTLRPAEILAQLAAYAPASAAVTTAELATARPSQDGNGSGRTIASATTAAGAAIRSLETAAMEFRALSVVRQVPFFFSSCLRQYPWPSSSPRVPK